MTSLFDSAVYEARRAIEWAEIVPEDFLKDVVLNGQGLATLGCNYRPDVSTRFWWTIVWKSIDGEQHSASAQTMQLCLWRAAVREKQIREKVEKQDKTDQEREA